MENDVVLHANHSMGMFITGGSRLGQPRVSILNRMIGGTGTGPTWMRPYSTTS